MYSDNDLGDDGVAALVRRRRAASAACMIGGCHRSASGCVATVTSNSSRSTDAFAAARHGGGGGGGGAFDVAARDTGERTTTAAGGRRRQGSVGAAPSACIAADRRRSPPQASECPLELLSLRGGKGAAGRSAGVGRSRVGDAQAVVAAAGSGRDSARRRPDRSAVRSRQQHDAQGATNGARVWRCRSRLRTRGGQTLDVSAHASGDAGATALSKALLSNQSLQVPCGSGSVGRSVHRRRARR